MLDTLGAEVQRAGLTATPLRKGLGLRFDTVVIGARIRELIEKKYLVRRPLLRAEGRSDRGGACARSAIRAGDFDAGELSRGHAQRA